MRRKAKWIIVVLAPFGMALFVFIGGEVVKSLWNWLAPPLFGLPLITFWQALGLLVLCRILFGGFSAHGSGKLPSRTPEERERFWKGACSRMGFGLSMNENKGSESKGYESVPPPTNVGGS